MNIIPYLNYEPIVAATCSFNNWVSIIGRTNVGDKCHFGDMVTLRADGHSITVGSNCWFGDYSTVHIADSLFGVSLSNNVTISRFGLAHACSIDENTILGENAVVMDNACVGANSLICADSVVPPGKKLESGWIYQGIPAKPVREISEYELDQLRNVIRAPEHNTSSYPIIQSQNRVPDIRHEAGLGVKENNVNGVYIAPTAIIAGDLTMKNQSSIWFGVEIDANRGYVEIGAESNVQDNSRITLDANETAKIGKRVTIGHNVRIHSCDIGDNCIIGMGSTLGKGTIVRNGGVVAAGAITAPNTEVLPGMIWSGNPARQSRALSKENADLFSVGVDVYKTYAKNYNAIQ